MPTKFMNKIKSPEMQKRIDALNKATLNALRTAGLTRARMDAIEKKIKNNESISDKEYEQYLLDCKYFGRNTPLKNI